MSPQRLKSVKPVVGRNLRRKKGSSRRSVAFGFIVTVGVLFGLFFGLIYFRPGVTVNQLPSNIPEYSSFWGNFIPSDALQSWFENYTAIRLYNSSYPTQYSTLLSVTQPSVSLGAGAIDSVLSVTLSEPNESVAIAFVNPQAFNNFTTAFSQLGYEAVNVGPDTMYGLVQNEYQGQSENGWIALVPQYRGIAFAVGSSDAKQALQICLQVPSSDSIMSKMNVRQMLYIANGTNGHLAIGIQAFPGVIPAGNNTMTVIGVSGGNTVVDHIIEFNSTSTAVSEYSTVQTDYRGSAFTVYDAYIQAKELQSITMVAQDVRLVE
jgi:hypothetical protein